MHSVNLAWICSYQIAHSTQTNTLSVTEKSAPPRRPRCGKQKGNACVRTLHEFIPFQLNLPEPDTNLAKLYSYKPFSYKANPHARSHPIHSVPLNLRLKTNLTPAPRIWRRKKKNKKRNPSEGFSKCTRPPGRTKKISVGKKNPCAERRGFLMMFKAIWREMMMMFDDV